MPGTLLQDEYEISLNCHDEDELEIPRVASHFSLLLDVADRSFVSVVTNDDAFFFDDLSIASSVESYCSEDIIEDDNSISTHTEIETGMDDAKTPAVVPLETKTTQREELIWKPLLARYNSLRERRRGGRRPFRCATSSTSTKVRKLLSRAKVRTLLSLAE